MSATVGPKLAFGAALGLLATLSMHCAASAAEQTSRWIGVPPSSSTVPPASRGTEAPSDSQVIEGDALREFDLKWSFIDWVNALAGANPQESASYISSVLGVDRATATQLIAFSAEATSRVNTFTRDLAPETCSALQAANAEESFVNALEAQDLRWDNLRAEVLGDFDSLFAGDTAARIHTFIEAKIRPGQKQIKTDLHKMLADPEKRETVRSRACGRVGK